MVEDSLTGEVNREQAREAVEEWLANSRNEFSPRQVSAGFAEPTTWGMLPEHQVGIERAMQFGEGYGPS